MSDRQWPLLLEKGTYGVLSVDCNHSTRCRSFLSNVSFQELWTAQPGFEFIYSGFKLSTLFTLFFLFLPEDKSNYLTEHCIYLSFCAKHSTVVCFASYIQHLARELHSSSSILLSCLFLNLLLLNPV